MGPEGPTWPVRSWLIWAPNTLSLICPVPKCRVLTRKQAELQTESQLFHTDSSANTAGIHSNGALELTNHGLQSQDCRGLGSETSTPTPQTPHLGTTSTLSDPSSPDPVRGLTSPWLIPGLCWVGPQCELGPWDLVGLYKEMQGPSPSPTLVPEKSVPSSFHLVLGYLHCS